MPTFSAKDVAKHSDEYVGFKFHFRKLHLSVVNNFRNSSVWVTFGVGVYDITKFIPEHPGAKKNIMLGAGSAIDPFW